MGQSWLFPPVVSDLIPVDHICNLAIAIVNSMGVSEVERKYRVQTRQSRVFTPDVAKTGDNGVH